MKLIHLKPRPHYETEEFHGLSPELFTKISTFFNQCAYSPVRKLRNSFANWSLGHLTQSLPQSLTDSSLQDLNFSQFCEFFLELNRHQEFKLLLDHWCSEDIHNPENFRTMESLRLNKAARKQKKKSVDLNNFTQKDNSFSAEQRKFYFVNPGVANC